MNEVANKRCWEITRDGCIPGGSVSVWDRGFRFGQHLFETILVREGSWLFFKEHLDILRISGEQARFQCDPDSWLNLCNLPFLPAASNLRNGTARIFWTAGEGAPTAPPAAGSLLFIWEEERVIMEQSRMRLQLQPFLCIPHGASPGAGAWKTGNYWQNITARCQAAARGFDEVLLANPGGKIFSAAMGNVFYKLEGKWFSPCLSDGARPGTTRKWLLEHAFASQRSLALEEVAFVTDWMVANSRIGPAAAQPDWTEHSPAPELAAIWQQWLRIC